MNIDPPRTPHALHGHVQMFHGIRLDGVTDVAEIREAHRSDHETPWAHARVEHTHNPTKRGTNK